MRKNQFLEFIEVKDRKIKREIEELFLKPITVSIDYIARFEIKEMKKIRPIQNIWYDWLINYVPNPIRKSVGGFKDKIVSLFKTGTPKETVNRREKILSNEKRIENFLYQKRTKKIKEKIVRDIWVLVEIEEEKEEQKRLDK